MRGGDDRGPRLLRFLFRALPRDFREAYGHEMTELIRIRHRRARGFRKRMGVWAAAARDVLGTGISMRWQGWRARGITRATVGWEVRVEGFTQDLRYAARSLARRPLFTLGAVALLAVGIGLNAAAFSVVDAFLFKPPPWESPERVVHVYQDSDDGEPSSSSFPATRDMAASPVFQAVTATTPSRAVWSGPDGPVELSTEYATSPYLEVAGLEPSRGRWFGPEHDVPGAAPVAVVSAGAWRRLFGGDPAVVGQSLTLNGIPVTVIGVGPGGLDGSFPPLATDLWLSISATHVTGSFQVANLERREDHWYDVRARLADGVTVEQARAAMDVLAARLAERFPELNRGRGIHVFPSREIRLHPQEDGNLRRAGALLAAVVLTVLLLASANLANLLLVRGLNRTGEMAVRTALGARRGRVIRLFFSEALLLTTAGGLAGLVVAAWILGAVATLPLPGPMGSAAGFGMDGRMMLVLVGLMGLTTLVFGLVPAVRGGRPGVASILRRDTPTASPGRGALRLSNGLVVIQMATSLVLVLVTGLLARSLVELRGRDRGVDADRVAFVRVDWGQAGLEGSAATVALEDVLSRIRRLPGVTRAAATSRLPATRAGSTTTQVEGYTPPAGTDAVELPFAVVSDDYFDAVGARVIRGRGFGPDDVPEGPASIIINETAANRFYGAADPVGRRMRGQGSEEWTRAVIGVVSDMPVNGLGQDPEPIVFFSARQSPVPPGTLVARSEADAGALVPGLRRALAEVHPALTPRAEGTLATHFGEALSGPRIAATTMGLFSLLALALAGLGIYAIVSFSVARRTTEIGIRVALGADRNRVVGMVIREVLGVVGAGLALGLAISYLAIPGLEGFLFGVGPLDPLSFAGAAAILLGVSALAAYLPARRASRADPARTLRVS